MSRASSKASTAPAAALLSAQAEKDPAAIIAVEMQRLQARFNDLDARRPPSSSKTAGYIRSELDHLSDRLSILRDYLTVVQAKSLTGAIAQLNEVHAVVDCMNARTAEDGRDERDYRRMTRLLYSADAALRTALPGLCEGIPSLPENLNPWLPIDQRMREVENSEAA